MGDQAEWAWVLAGELGEFKGGSGFPTKYQGEGVGKYPFYKVSDMNSPGNEKFMKVANNYVSEEVRGSLGATAFPEHSIVFAKVGAAVFLERKRLLSRPSCIDNNMAAFIVDSTRLNWRFAHHALMNFRLGSLVAVGALPSLNGDQLRSIPLMLPPTWQGQVQVANVLDEADELINALKLLIEKKCNVKQGMMQELLTGRTRLPGFSAEWKSRTFDEVMEVLNTRRSQVDVSRYLEVGAYPVIDQGRQFIAGYVGLECLPIHTAAEGVCVFGDHTTVSKYVDFDFIVGADGTKVFRSRSFRDCDTRYFCYLLEFRPVEPAGYNRHFRKLRERQLLMPSGEEQRAISEVLQAIDTEIEALERRLESARAVKVGMMQELLTGRTRLPVKEEA